MTVRYFDRKLKPITAAEYNILRKHREYTEIRRDPVGREDAIVTYWLGVDYGTTGSPVVFETWSTLTSEAYRSTTEEEALKAHENLLDLAINGGSYQI